MNFPAIFIGIVIMAIAAPVQFAELGSRLVAGLFPVIEKGLVLAIMVFGIAMIAGRIK